MTPAEWLEARFDAAQQLWRLSERFGEVAADQGRTSPEARQIADEMKQIASEWGPGVLQ
ncbi:hypothetical protein GCM10027294_25340 [Marinactinospora endophytica]